MINNHLTGEMKENTDEKYKYEIRPGDINKLIDLNQLFEYRDLIILLVKRDFTASYAQTMLGPFWCILNPLLTSVVYGLVFGNLAKLSTADVYGQDIVPGFLFYFSGSIVWGYFSSTAVGVSGCFRGNLLHKVYFPRMVIPVSTALSKMVSFLIQFGILAVAFIVYAISGVYTFKFSSCLIFIPLLLLQVTLLALGVGMIVASLTVCYRDLNHFMPFVMQIWHYGTPVAYGLTLIPARYRMAFLTNPLSPVITSFRFCLFTEGYFNWKVTALSILITLCIYIFGRILYIRAEKNVVDTI